MKDEISDRLCPQSKRLPLLIFLSAFILHPSSFILSSSAQLVVTPTTNATADETTALKKQFKETQDRLQAFEADNEALRRLNDSSKKTIHALTESLAVANAELEVFRRRYTDQRAQMEALGLAAVGDNKEALEQRLLKSVSDLKLLRDEKDKIAERMVALSETVLLYMKTATSADPQLRLKIEAQLRAASEAVADTTAKDNGQTTAPAGGLTNAQVISVKEDLSLVISNVGSQQGVKIGMPFLIQRGDHLVARARVVDVREKISGAIIEEYNSNTEKVKVGDTMHVEVQG